MAERAPSEALTLDEATAAILDGFGSARRARPRPATDRHEGAHHRPCARRRAVEVAEGAIRWRDAGVVGSTSAVRRRAIRRPAYLDAFETIRANFDITIRCRRVVRLAVDLEALQFAAPSGSARRPHRRRHHRPRRRVGRARPAGGFVRDRRVPLEMCPSSNVHTGAGFDRRRTRSTCSAACAYRVTVNTDNRLMSGVRLSRSSRRSIAAFGNGLGEDGVADDQRAESGSPHSTSGCGSSTRWSSAATPASRGGSRVIVGDARGRLRSCSRRGREVDHRRRAANHHRDCERRQ